MWIHTGGIYMKFTIKAEWTNIRLHWIECSRRCVCNGIRIKWFTNELYSRLVVACHVPFQPPIIGKHCALCRTYTTSSNWTCARIHTSARRAHCTRKWSTEVINNYDVIEDLCLWYHFLTFCNADWRLESDRLWLNWTNEMNGTQNRNVTKQFEIMQMVNIQCVIYTNWFSASFWGTHFVTCVISLTVQLWEIQLSLGSAMFVNAIVEFHFECHWININAHTTYIDKEKTLWTLEHKQIPFTKIHISTYSRVRPRISHSSTTTYGFLFILRLNLRATRE